VGRPVAHRLIGDADGKYLVSGVTTEAAAIAAVLADDPDVVITSVRLGLYRILPVSPGSSASDEGYGWLYVPVDGPRRGAFHGAEVEYAYTTAPDRAAAQTATEETDRHA
jgi:hypothetical protein